MGRSTETESENETEDEDEMKGNEIGLNEIEGSEMDIEKYK